MVEQNNEPGEPSSRESFWASRSGIVLATFLAIGGFLLAYEHRVHIFTGNGILIGLLLACVVMHFFMHGGHGGHSGGEGQD